jgi:sulfonate transport system substrate-binding protein
MSTEQNKKSATDRRALLRAGAAAAFAAPIGAFGAQAFSPRGDRFSRIPDLQGIVRAS